MKNTTKTLAITGIAFSVYYGLNKLFFLEIYQQVTVLLQVKTLSFFLTYLIVGLPLLLGLFLLHPAKFILESLGLKTGVVTGMVVAFLFTLPMLIGFALVFKFDTTVTFNKIFGSVICAALFEEVYFRGFLFGQLYRFTRIGFIPAILLGALVFAAGHLYQSTDLGTMTGIFITTFLGAGLFAWTYIEWANNLWVPIWLHLFMNLFWLLFSAGDNALGGIYSNIFRGVTIALIIGGTIVYKKRKGLPLAVNRETIWMKTSQLLSSGF